MGSGSDTFATLGFLNSAVGGASRVAGGYSESVAARGQANYQGKMMDVAARGTEIMADDATHRGEKQVSRMDARNRDLVASQRAAAATNEVEVDSGSAGAIQADTEGLGELERATIRHNAYLEAMGYRMRASSERSSGRFARLAGRGASRGAINEGLMGGARDLEAGAYKYGKLKVPTKDA